ncbi:MAG: PAS domain S-box protein [Gammaproteobacteria bacterium]|nr:PAS domain S-box protein [Gammaproteobacteria bacterium]
MDLTDAQVRALLDAAPDAIVAADESGAIVYANRQIERLFGYRREEILGQPIEMLLPQRYRGAHPGFRRGYAAAPRVRPMGGGLDLYARRSDGSEFPVEISLSPFPTAQGLLVSSAIRDVTERRAMLEELRVARREADRANRAKSAFLATASHDLRQPLQTLTLLNDVLRRSASEPRAAAAIATQGDALSSMAELLNSLLDISKLESGAVVPDIQDFSVQSVCRHVRSAFEEQARSKGLEFVVEDCDAVVHCDRGLLEQMIQNLVANAIRYTREGMVRMRCLGESLAVRIEVLDTGIGIPAHQQEAIFEEFFQLNRAPGQKREGLGLGLAIVRRISQLLKLPVEVESAPGRGSRFAVTVPRGGEAARRAELHAPSERAAPSRIVLVDDDPAVARATGLLLEIEGHEVRIASSAEELRALIADRGRAPDLVVTDLHLGGESTGIDLVRELRTALGREVPALLVTGDTSARTADEVRRCGRCLVLSKPVEPGEFLDRINQLLRPE